MSKKKETVKKELRNWRFILSLTSSRSKEKKSARKETMRLSQNHKIHRRHQSLGVKTHRPALGEGSRYDKKRFTSDRCHRTAW